MSLTGKRVANYRILNSLGKGGMGEVFVASDETLGRKVALKAIRADKRLSPRMKARFLREARILSRLDHPSICRIYNYIEEEQGDYLVLELIEGENLHDALQRHIPPALRMKIAERLADVLVAAHEAGVVHRDLKPQNVMLSSDGEIKVLDFGLARSAETSLETEEGAAPSRVDFDDSDDGWGAEVMDTIDVTDESAANLLTQMGQILGTPTYMSPEQARGELVTAASDMYSLGLLLQELFTGIPPYEPDLGAAALLHKARNGETRSVTGLDRHLTDLINRLKSLTPTARPTAMEVSRRLRWIREKPKRRLRVLTIGALVLIALVAGLKYMTDLRRERTIAVAARAEADRRRAQAEDLISFMLGDLRDKLAPVGRLDVLDAVGDKALEYFDSLSKDEVTDEEILRRSKALAQIGDVRMAQGDLTAAMEAFRESEALAESLVARDPRTPAWLANLGASRFWIGAVHWEQGDLDGALKEFRSYAEIAKDLVALEPENKEWLLELAYTHNNIGAVLDAKGDIEEAVDELRRSVEISRELVGAEPDNAAWISALAEALSWLGSTTEANGDLNSALQHFREELRMRGELVLQDPDNADWQERLSTSYNHVGLILRAKGDVEGAVENLENDLRIARRLVAKDSANTEWRRDLAVSHLQLGLALLDGDRTLTAMEQFRAANETIERLVHRDRGNVDWQRVLLEARNALATADLAAGNVAAALAGARSTRTTLEPLQRSRPEDTEIQRLVAESHLLRGNALAASGEPEQARAAWSEVVRILGPLAQDSNDRRFLVPLARALLHLDRIEEARSITMKLSAQGFSSRRFAALCREKDLSF
jgi:serine/threonine-protein kinase